MLDQNISNQAAVPQDFKMMVVSNDPNDVASRIQGYLKCVEACKDGSQEAISHIRIRILKYQPLTYHAMRRRANDSSHIRIDRTMGISSSSYHYQVL